MEIIEPIGLTNARSALEIQAARCECFNAINPSDAELLAFINRYSVMCSLEQLRVALWEQEMEFERMASAYDYEEKRR